MRKQTNYGDGDGDLPEELWWQILSLLPVETLVVVRAVCKPFLSIISDSDFVSFHLRRFPDNALGTQVFNVFRAYEISPGDPMGWPCKACFVNSTTTTSLACIDFPTDHSSTNYKLDFLGSLDGLVLLLFGFDLDYPDIVLLWNPSIRKHRQLCELSASKYIAGPDNFQLGYHKSANDYKVVFFGEEDDYEAAVYSLKTGTWTDLTLQYNNGVPTILYEYNHVLSFDHGVVWIGIDLLVFFDFQTHTFHCADDVFYPADQKYPHDPFDFTIRSGLIILDGGCSVGSWGIDLENQPYIWSLQTESMSWTKRYKISRELVQFGLSVNKMSFVERNGELVWTYWKSPVPAYPNCKILGVLSYDIDKQVIKTTSHIEFSSHFYGIYIQSLVMLN